MRRFTHPVGRGIGLLLMSAYLALTAGCGTSQPRPAEADGQTAAQPAPASIDPQPDRGFRPSPYADLFAAAESALAEGDWMAAGMAIPTADNTVADAEFEAYAHYIHAGIAWQRGQLAAMTQHLRRARAHANSDELILRIQRLQRERAYLERQHLAYAELSIGMQERLPPGHPEASPLAADTWRALQRLPLETLRRATEDADSDLVRGWLMAARLSPSASSVGEWRSRFPSHPAGAFLNATPDTTAPRRVALILPLSGRIADAAAAVREGFIRHYFEQREAGAIAWDLIALDTGDYASVTQAYNAAIDSGAQLVVGPLTKSAVTDLLAMDTLPIPVIALNRAGDEAAVHTGSLQFALAPEDEAAQIARLAFADGHRRALLVRPAGEWGDKMEQALRDAWLPLGGEIAATAQFGSRETQSAGLTAALDLDASRERASALRRQLSQPIEISGRRRQDIDAVFLLAPSVGDARSLKPLLAFHYAGNLPAYSTSAANSDDRRGDENDLNGLTLVEMPRILNGRARSDTHAMRGDSYTRLGALGADACRLAGRSMLALTPGNPILQGETGFLSLNDRRQIERDLTPAVFDRGTLQPR